MLIAHVNARFQSRHQIQPKGGTPTPESAAPQKPRGRWVYLMESQPASHPTSGKGRLRHRTVPCVGKTSNIRRKLAQQNEVLPRGLNSTRNTARHPFELQQMIWFQDMAGPVAELWRDRNTGGQMKPEFGLQLAAFTGKSVWAGGACRPPLTPP